MSLKGMYLLKLMQFNEHLSGFLVRQTPSLAVPYPVTDSTPGIEGQG
jgi:hypothetical protein